MNAYPANTSFPVLPPPARPTLPLREGLLLPFRPTRRWVVLSQILRLEGESNYTICHFTDGTQLLVALSLKRLAERLPIGAFMRPHRKHLINRQYICDVQAREYKIMLTNGDRIAIARRRVVGFLQEYKNSGEL